MQLSTGPPVVKDRGEPTLHVLKGLKPRCRRVPPMEQRHKLVFDCCERSALGSCGLRVRLQYRDERKVQGALAA